jgi:hypothetical protein
MSDIYIVKYIMFKMRAKFYTTDSANGTSGIYIRYSDGSTWTKQ